MVLPICPSLLLMAQRWVQTMCMIWIWMTSSRWLCSKTLPHPHSMVRRLPLVSLSSPPKRWNLVVYVWIIVAPIVCLLPIWQTIVCSMLLKNWSLSVWLVFTPTKLTSNVNIVLIQNTTAWRKSCAAESTPTGCQSPCATDFLITTVWVLTVATTMHATILAYATPPTTVWWLVLSAIVCPSSSSSPTTNLVHSLSTTPPLWCLLIRKNLLMGLSPTTWCKTPTNSLMLPMVRFIENCRISKKTPCMRRKQAISISLKTSISSIPPPCKCGSPTPSVSMVISLSPKICPRATTSSLRLLSASWIKQTSLSVGNWPKATQV